MVSLRLWQHCLYYQVFPLKEKGGGTLSSGGVEIGGGVMRGPIILIDLVAEMAEKQIL